MRETLWHARSLQNRFGFIAEETKRRQNKNQFTLAYRLLEATVYFKENELKQRARINLETYFMRPNYTIEFKIMLGEYSIDKIRILFMK